MFIYSEISLLRVPSQRRVRKDSLVTFLIIFERPVIDFPRKSVLLNQMAYLGVLRDRVYAIDPRRLHILIVCVNTAIIMRVVNQHVGIFSHLSVLILVT